jgi:glycosyltransferase involved in cell wall biosynthesis
MSVYKDKTAEILSHYDDPRLRVIHQDNMGLSASLNRGLKMARTELVVRMDGDDISLLNRIEVQLREYERLGRPDVLGGRVEYISENGTSLGFCRCPLTHNEINKALEGEGGGAIFHPTVLYKKDSVLRHGGYDPFFRYSTEDYDLWFRMSKDCRFANTNQVVLKLRLNSQGMESQIVKRGNLSRNSSSWFICVARQRHQFEKEGAGHLWRDPRIRKLILDLLWPKFVKSGYHQSIFTNRALALIRADLKTSQYIYRGLFRAACLCLNHPISTIRYLVARKHPKPTFLSIQDITG